jgi:5-(carboxyamino)imidazole ribonucleotide synthase
MLNLIGSMPSQDVNLNSDAAWLHDYGKEPRPGRKLGHITIVAASPADREREIARVRELLIA